MSQPLKALANSRGKQFCLFTGRLQTRRSPREPGGSQKVNSVRNLHSYLLQLGSGARCWAHIGAQKNVFAWTGDNLESERLIGGNDLAKEITYLEARADISRYNIIAHSHGGNVVLHALRSLADDPRKLGAVIFLGAPV